MSSQVSLAPAAQLVVDEAFPVSRQCCFRRICSLLATCIPLVLVTWLPPHQDLMREAFVSRFTDGKAEAQRGRVECPRSHSWHVSQGEGVWGGPVQWPPGLGGVSYTNSSLPPALFSFLASCTERASGGGECFMDQRTLHHVGNAVSSDTATVLVTVPRSEGKFGAG